jgi:hypothetical protein
MERVLRGGETPVQVTLRKLPLGVRFDKLKPCCSSGPLQP